ncbi:hypothetical protein P154DRAFT_304868 [Amniculicola lignicola CBS 123094]|uniref:Uncharacterized protein n=1 Tax=Amniculicola lignicola CBS 123094 TaxID=1392246 RepID=A0A6A5W7X3_9PLEO|nr:hypothetical protein P154DRAFT_304868 [Amniculicola lignicola CBS 123094]
MYFDAAFPILLLTPDQGLWAGSSSTIAERRLAAMFTPFQEITTDKHFELSNLNPNYKCYLIFVLWPIYLRKRLAYYNGNV